MKILGIDGGISSVGWAMIETGNGNSQGEILGTGVWMFNSPEISTKKGPVSKNQERRQAQGARRLVKRRRQRMNAIRSLFQDHGLIHRNTKNALHFPSMNPWQLRCDALERKLSPEEFAKALSHVAKHRGYHPNTKADNLGKNESKEEGRMLSAISKNEKLISRYRTPAVMLMSDSIYEKKYGEDSCFTIRSVRNRDGNYTRTILRIDLVREIKTIFLSQKRFGNAFANDELETEFLKIVEHQHEMPDTEHLVGDCAFEPSAKRCSKLAPSFERFRLLQKLVNLKIVGRAANRLTPDELTEINRHFGLGDTMTYSDVREIIGLDRSQKFSGIKFESEVTTDVVSKRGKTSPGTYALRNLITEKLGESCWEALVNAPVILDQITNVVSFRRKSDSVLNGLSDITGITADVSDVIYTSWKEGAFESFVGATHISDAAARNIIPGLLKGLTYDKACLAAGYDPASNNEKNAFKIELDGSVVTGKEALKQILSQQKVDEKLIGSPTARKAIIEVLKQVKAIIEEYGMPDRIHIELARDISNSIKKRAEIDKGINERTKYRTMLPERFENAVGRRPHPGGAGANDLLRFELWEQQGHHCIYTNTYIPPSTLSEDDGSLQIDHILPWSRFGDNSLNNRVLCLSKANQEKRGRTPYEWFKADKTDADWKRFVASVNGSKTLKGMKKRNLLIEDASELEAGFRSRNLNDTRWASKITLEALKYVLPDVQNADGSVTRRVFARPGAITSLFRNAWGLNHIKKDENGNRKSDDRHHALDAVIVAAVTERQLQLATSEVQRLEQQGLPIRLSKCIAEPWDGFRTEALTKIEKIFVARQESRRALGQVHQETVRSFSERDGKLVAYNKVSVHKLTLKNLNDIKDKERNWRLVEVLKEWIEAGSPKDKLPVLPHDKSKNSNPPSIISKVTVKYYKGVDLTIPRGSGLGAVDQKSIVRTDVFSKPDKKGDEYYLVPIYRADIFTLKEPPLRFITKGKNGNNLIGKDHTFCFSLYPNTLVKFTRSNGEKVEGYYRRVDTDDSRITVLNPSTSDSTEGVRFSKKDLNEFRKLTVDRLGRVFEVKGEKRTWHGKVCT